MQEMIQHKIIEPIISLYKTSILIIIKKKMRNPISQKLNYITKDYTIPTRNM